MKFLSIFRTAETGAFPPQEEMERMQRLVEEGMRAGYLLAVEGCMPSSFGAKVRRSGDKITITDGPFAESKEVVGGLALIQADSKEQAIEYVKKFLGVAAEGECELRQLFEANCAETVSAA